MSGTTTETTLRKSRINVTTGAITFCNAKVCNIAAICIIGSDLVR